MSRLTAVAREADTDANVTPRAPAQDPYEEPATEPDLRDRCAMCGRDLWSDGLPPARDGNRWICGDRDQARNFDALDF